jgi:hypothetical protein
MSLFDRSGLTAAFAGHDSDRYPMARVGTLAAETNAHPPSQRRSPLCQPGLQKLCFRSSQPIVGIFDLSAFGAGGRLEPP